MHRKGATAYDYGEYGRLTAALSFHRLVRSLNKVSRATRVPYAVVGGLAAYLHVKNPPLDYPDVDLMLDANPDRAEKFIEGLRREPGWRMELFDIGPSGDVFAAFLYRGEIQTDIFTSQETRLWLKGAVRKGGLRVERPEPLVVEKLVRGTFEDLMMAVDLLARGRYDRRMLGEIASQYRAGGRVRFMERLARVYATGRIGKKGLAVVLRRMALR